MIDFLSHAAIVGFMGGAAITIALQQLKGFLGIKHFTKHTDIISVMQSVWDAVDHGVSIIKTERERERENQFFKPGLTIFFSLLAVELEDYTHQRIIPFLPSSDKIHCRSQVNSYLSQYQT